MKAKVRAGLAVLALLFVASAPVAAADTVLRVVVVQTDDVAEYVKQLERGKAILEKAGSSGVIRVWRASFAGSDAGSIVVSIEFENMQAFAAETAKLDNNEEFQTWVRGLDKIRKIVSDSLYREL